MRQPVIDYPAALDCSLWRGKYHLLSHVRGYGHGIAYASDCSF